MNESGMTPMEVIFASTKIAAECLGLEDRGVLASGKKADLFIVDQNPLEDFHALKGEKTVIKDGAIIYNHFSNFVKEKQLSI